MIRLSTLSLLTVILGVQLLHSQVLLAANVHARSVEMFRIEFESVQVDSPKFQELEANLYKAYRFVAYHYGDPINRNLCPITVVFKKIEKYRDEVIRTDDPCKARVEMNDDFLEHGTLNVGVTFAHVVSHLIRQANNPKEENWLDEGLAEYIEHAYINMVPPSTRIEIEDRNELYLEHDPEKFYEREYSYVMVHYFVRYLADRYGGKDLLKKLMHSKLSGWESITTALDELFSPEKASSQTALTIEPQFRTPQALWTKFSLAVLLNNPDLAVRGVLHIGEHHDANINRSKQFPASVVGLTEFKPWTTRFFAVSALRQSPQTVTRWLQDKLGVFAVSRKNGKTNLFNVRTADDLQKHADVYVVIRYE